MTSERSKRIVIIGPAHPFRGGIADTNEAMARAFIADGWQVDLVTFSVQYPSFLFPGKSQFSSEAPPEKLTIQRWIHSFNPFNWIVAARKIKRLNPDVVLFRYWLPLMAPCFGSLARMLKFKSTVIGLTDNVIPHEKRLMDRQLTAFFMKQCHGFMALSRSVESDLRSLSSKPSSYFPHPINDQLGEKVERSQARKLLGLDEGGTYLLFFGFIRKYKGLDLLLQAMADERLSKLNVKLVIAGESYESTANYEAMIVDLGIENRVKWVNSFIPSEEVPLYFCAADLVTQTYRTATQSGITQMALHFDVPALITRVGGLDEFLVEGKTGLFCHPEPEDIADQILAFLAADSSSYTAAIKEEKKRFSWRAFVQHFNSFYSTNFRP